MGYSERKILLQSVSPDGRWNLIVEGPTETTPQLYATFYEEKRFWGSFPFGYDAQKEIIGVRWDLAEQVCGLYIGSNCYALFRLGAKRHKRRERCSVIREKPFSENDVQKFIARYRDRIIG